LVSRLAKLLFLSTAFAPFLLVSAAVEIVRGSFLPLGLRDASIAVLLVFICWAIITFAVKKLQATTFTFNKLRIAGKEAIPLILTYSLPIARAAAAPLDWRPMTVIILFLGILAWRTHAYLFNPLLMLLGYRLYEVTADSTPTFLLVSHRTWLPTNQTLSTVRLFDHILIDRETR
jgi:hypothetical protein